MQPCRVSRTFRDGGAFFQRRCHALQLRQLALAHVRTLCVLDRLPQSCDSVCLQSLRRDNWSTYALATTNCAGHSIFCWFCTFSSLTRTDFAASISFCVRNCVGVNSKTSRPRAISEP